jgi:uncharacterized repeat protein (TIGR02543 family)
MKKKIGCILLSVVFALSLAGCTLFEQGPKLEYGDFVYCYVKQAKSDRRTFKKYAKGINILELTEEGQKKGTIIIPENIDGLPVIAIGMGGLGWGTEFGGQYQKIYLPCSLLTIWDSERVLWNHCRVFLFDNCISTNWENRTVLLQDILPTFGLRLFVPESLYQEYQNIEGVKRLEKIKTANTTYIVDEEVYWIDHYYDGEYVTFPEAPTKDGYVFNGWYKEQECINEWQEATDTYSKSEEVKTVNLYAKWIESE